MNTQSEPAFFFQDLLAAIKEFGTQDNSDGFSAFSVQGFCEDHNLSRGMFYKLEHDGLAPRSFKVGSRRLITKEAARDWRLEMETKSNQEES